MSQLDKRIRIKIRILKINIRIFKVRFKKIRIIQNLESRICIISELNKKSD